MLLFDRLPILRDRVLCREASSHDRRGGNDNGFSNKAEYVRRERGLRVTILDVAGPGCVRSFWYSWPNHPLLPGFIARWWGRALGKVRFFFDGESTPRLAASLCRWVGTPPFSYPLAIDGEASTGGYISYVPLAYHEGLRVTVDGGKLPMFFFHVWYHCYPMGEAAPLSWTGEEDLSAMASQWEPAAALVPAGPLCESIEGFSLPAGASRELLRAEGEGTIGCLRMKLPEDDAALRSLWLRVWWDGEERASLDAPLSLLFAIENRFSTEPAAISKNAPLAGPVIGKDPEGFYYFRLPMPYARSVRLCLENRGQRSASVGGIRIERAAEALPGVGSRAGYLRTEFRESRELPRGRDYLLADLKGRGLIVGTVLAVAGTEETFLEGDERICIDGCRSPLVMGDATETYFNGSWYFGERAFACPLHGAPTFRMAKKRVGAPTTATMYRFHLSDFVPYRSGARFTIQHGPFNNVEGHYRSLVFYYGLSDPSIVESDRLVLCDPEDLRSHDFAGAAPHRQERREGFFEGEFNGQDLGHRRRPNWVPPMLWMFYLTMRGIFHDPPPDSPDRACFTVCEHAGPYEFTATIDPDNSGLLLRRLFDQSIADQRARIEVDGTVAGIWYNAGRNRWKIWAEDDLMLDPAASRGKSQVRIRIVPESPLFSAAEYRVFSLLLPEEVRSKMMGGAGNSLG